MNEQTINGLNSFKEKNKFSNQEWDNRGLIPSSPEFNSKMSRIINECCDDLIKQIQTDQSGRELKKTIKNSLRKINKRECDTEEKEFITDYFFELSQIINVDVKDELNSWIYGSLFNGLIKITNAFKSPPRIVETLSQDCTQCGAKLETFITKKQQGIPDFAFNVVKCKSCNEFNLIDIGPNVHSFSFGEYEPIEQLRKDEYTKEQADRRLEQIKYWRNN